MSIIGESLIYADKETAIHVLTTFDLSMGFDGQEIVARYYDENGDIASVLGIVHKTNGVENIEIKDGEGGGDGECKLKAWTNATTNHQDPEGENWRYEPFANKYGIYHSVNNLNDGNGTTEGTVLSKNGDTNVYTATYDDGRPMGDRYIYGGGALVVRYKNRDPELSGGEMQEGYFILDPHKHDKQVEDVLKTSGTLRHWQGETFVIKQAIKLGSVEGVKYYFQGRGIKFQMPRVRRNCSVRVYFPDGFYPYAYRDTGSMMHCVRGKRCCGTFIDAVENGDIIFDWRYDQNTNLYYIYLENNDDIDMTNAFTVTMERYTGNQYRNNSRPHTIITMRRSRCANPEDVTVSEENRSVSVYADDYFDVEEVQRITRETTSPGFRIEEGIIRCYRHSDFSELLKSYGVGSEGGSSHFERNLKFVKDGVVFQYHKRNMDIGTSPVLVRETRKLFDTMTELNVPGGSSYNKHFLHEREGYFEFVAPVWRRRFGYWSRPVGDGLKVCNITGRFSGTTETDGLVFSFNKTVSTAGVMFKNFTFEYRGTDGEIHTKKVGFRHITNPEASTFTHTVWLDTADAPPANNASITVTRISVRADFENEEYTMHCPGVSKRKFSRTRWHKMTWYRKPETIHSQWGDYSVPYAHTKRSKFKKHRFHRCRYTKKYKGVPSEFPELFYMR